MARRAWIGVLAVVVALSLPAQAEQSQTALGQGGTLEGVWGVVTQERHGIWRHDGGLTHTARVVTMINFETAPGTPPGSPAFQAGWQAATQTITLSGPDSFTMTGASQFFNLNREAYRAGCASRVGERFR